MNKFFNRPISPHLTIYLPQLSSTFSIWHRLSATLLVGYGLLHIYIQKLFAWGLSYPLTYFFTFSLLENPFVKFFISSILFYHTSNGLRHIIWDLGKGLTSVEYNRSNIYIVVGTFCLQVLFFKTYL